MTTIRPIPSPVSLSYAAALRGIAPRKPGEAFVYVDLACNDAEYLIAMAASNPEGKFYAFSRDEISRARSSILSLERKVSNVTFVQGDAASALANLRAGNRTIPAANYVVLNSCAAPLSKAQADTLYDLAAALLAPGGLFNSRYRLRQNASDTLHFLIQEFAPEMDAEQKKTFLLEIKKLGGFYLSGDHDVATRLDQAIAQGKADEFFASFSGSPTVSATFETMVALRSRGFAFAGDTTIANNYVELSVPSEAQELVMSCQSNMLYEPIKDFVLNRDERSDIWCYQPQPTSTDMAALFGNFAFGTTLARGQIPTEYKAQGKMISLKSDLYQKLLDMLSLMPITVGDFLSHPSSAGNTPDAVIEAVQILVACGLVRPMRGMAVIEDLKDITAPRIAGDFNQFLCSTNLSSPDVTLASPTIGEPLIISTREALVMQALHRAGLANSVNALYPELERVAQTPALAARIMDTTTLTPEIARTMVENVITDKIVNWYAYGILKSAA